LICEGQTYDRIAVSISNGHGFAFGAGMPTAIVMPLYPAFLALLYWVFGHSVTAGLLGNAVLSSFTCVIIYFIAKKIFNERVGILSAFIASLHYFLISAVTRLWTETLFTFFVTLSIYYFIKILYEEHSLLKLVIFSIICAFSVLVKPGFVFFPFILILFLFIRDVAARKGTFTSFLKASVIILLIFLLPILLWSARNFVVFKSFMPLSSESGLGLYLSYNPEKGKIFGTKDIHDPVIQKGELIESEVKRNEFYKNEASGVIRDLGFAKLFKLVLLKIYFFWNIIDWEFIGNGLATYNYASAFIYPFFLLGVLLCFKNNIKALLLAVPVFYAMAFSALTMGMARFRMPIEPCLIIFSGYAIYFLYKNLNRLWVSVSIGSWLILNIYLYYNSHNAKLFFKFIGIKLGLW